MPLPCHHCKPRHCLDPLPTRTPQRAWDQMPTCVSLSKPCLRCTLCQRRPKLRNPSRGGVMHMALTKSFRTRLLAAAEHKSPHTLPSTSKRTVGQRRSGSCRENLNKSNMKNAHTQRLGNCFIDNNKGSLQSCILEACVGLDWRVRDKNVRRTHARSLMCEGVSKSGRPHAQERCFRIVCEHARSAIKPQPMCQLMTSFPASRRAIDLLMTSPHVARQSSGRRD